MSVITLFFASALSLLVSIHLLANTFFLYWKYPWLDMPMHLLGGVTIAMGMALPYVSRLSIARRFSPLATTLIAVCIFGIGWEVYELGTGTSVYKDGFWPDTILDIAMDFLGGLIGYGVATRIKNI